ncbi:MAG TPA: hypothetical protein PKA80_11800 [Ignavibacteriaceae bacterium]|nr:hypothetical protein [Ignavibacteriaceae bacterium]
MKWLLSLTLLILPLVFISCSKEDSNIPNATEKSSGILSLKIDRLNAPANVEQVVAYLTRQGFEPIINSLNLLTDSTADITFEAIPVGVWHLKVDALNGDGDVVYTGETDVEVLDGVLVQVTLTLQPTGNGTGTIYLYVTWGTGSFGWIDYINNPILVKTGSTYDKFGVGQTFVIKDESGYKMYFSGLSDYGKTYVFLATSSDGLTWTRYSNLPVLYPGAPGTWDAGRCAAGPVLFEDGIYKMYYHGFYDVYGPWSIGLATSTDGINWVKQPNPILSGNNWDFRIFPTQILKVENSYYLYYTGYPFDYNGKIGLAISNDGYSWQRYSENPIMVPDQSWELGSIGFPSIIFENGIYEMVYQSFIPENNGFGYAHSTDGINWQKDASNPFFTSDDTVDDLLKIGWASYLKIENEYRIYYTGYAYNGADWTICVARKFIL